MAKLIAALIVGVGLGAGVVLLVPNPTGEGESISPAPRALETSPDVLTTTQSLPSRSQVKSLADIQALPSEFERSAALYARLESTDVGAVEILLDEAEELTNAGRVKQVIYSRFVQLDARAALERLRAEERDEQLLIRTTVSTVASFDLDAALAFIDTLDQTLQVQLARNVLDSAGVSHARKEEIAKRFSLELHLRRLQAISRAKRDPAGAWQTALAIEKTDEQREMLWSVANTWFETDPSAALSAVASVDAPRAGSWRAQLLDRWVRKDPDAALQWAIAQPGSGPSDPLRLAAAVVARRSPQEMFELAATLEPARRDMVAEMVLHAWGRNDPLAALDALARMDNAHLRKMIGISIVGSWANDDPKAAFEWVQVQEPSAMRTSMFSSALRNLGKSDPLRALSFANELDDTMRSTAIEWVLGVWGKEDPLSAASWLDSTDDTTPAAVIAVARHNAEVDPEAAFEWLQDQSVEAQRSVVPTTVVQVAAESPESALRLVNRIEDSNTRAVAGSQLMSTWVRTAPRAAVLAIDRLDDSMGPLLYQSAFRSWSLFDPEGATAFLDQVPSSDRDDAIQGMLQRKVLGSADLAERKLLFDQLTSDEGRRRGAIAMFVSLREFDPKRAEHYRQLSGIPDNQRINTSR